MKTVSTPLLVVLSCASHYSSFREPTNEADQCDPRRSSDATRLLIAFSDGRSGVRDCSDILAAGGPMAEPLRNQELFSRVFVQCGVPTWPNGFNIDAIRLHDEMSEAGLLAATPKTAREAAE